MNSLELCKTFRQENCLKGRSLIFYYIIYLYSIFCRSVGVYLTSQLIQFKNWGSVNLCTQLPDYAEECHLFICLAD